MIVTFMTLGPSSTMGATLDRADDLLTRAHHSLIQTSADVDFGPVTSADVSALLKIAVGFPAASDAELVEMLTAKFKRVSSRVRPGCGGCNADCGGND
jgi:hypothetical protein